MGEHRKALVVAIDQYAHPTLRALLAPTTDATELADVLGDPLLGGFDVNVLSNANSWEVAAAVEGFLGDCAPTDLLLLHFSCHGIKDERGELFLAASNTVPNRLISTAVDSSLVSRLIQRSRAQRVILLLDCCYGGAFERGVVARATDEINIPEQFSQGLRESGRGRVVITASSAMEYAFEGAELSENAAPRPSLFTGALVEGIRSGEADRDQDGQVALRELYEYVHDKVRERTPDQTPSKWEFGVQGELYVARNPHRQVSAAALAPELVELASHHNSAVRLTAVTELETLAQGAQLRLAAGARDALRQLVGDDSRRVSLAASEVLRRTTLSVSPHRVDLGDRKPGELVHVEARLEGGPLACAVNLKPSSGAVRGWVDASVVRLEVKPEGLGRFEEFVELTGPCGSAEVRIFGTVTAATGAVTSTQAAAVPAPAAIQAQPPAETEVLSAPPWRSEATASAGERSSTPPPVVSLPRQTRPESATPRDSQPASAPPRQSRQESTPPHESQRASAHEPPPAEVRQPASDVQPQLQLQPQPPITRDLQLSVVVWSAVAVLALIAATLTWWAVSRTPPSDERMNPVRDLDIRWLGLAAPAGVLSVALLRARRYEAVGAGLLLGSAAWMWVFWLRVVMLRVRSNNPVPFAEAFQHGSLLRLLAAVLFTGACAVMLAGFPALRRFAGLRRDTWAILGCLFALTGAALQETSWLGHLPSLVQGIAIVLFFGWVPLVLLNGQQRSAALVATATYVVCSGLRDVVAIVHAWETVGQARVVVVVGLLLVLAGVMLGQHAWALSRRAGRTY